MESAPRTVLFCHGLESGPHGSKFQALVMDTRYSIHLPVDIIEEIEADPADYTVRLASGTVRVDDGYLAPDYYYRGVCIEYVDGVNERTYGLYRTRVAGGSVRHDTLALARRWVDTELARREARGVALPETGA